MRLRQPDLRARTKALSLRVLKLFKELPPGKDAQILGKRLMRYVTRAGAYYRAAVRCRTLKSYINRIDCAIYDLELSAYWLELLIEGEIAPKLNLASVLAETQEVIAILVGCKRKAKKAGNQMTEMSSN
jgi:four helix bundle protein